MKKQLIIRARQARLWLLAIVLSMSFSSLQAQNYIPPVAYEDTYPSSTMAIGNTTHTSAYSWSMAPLGVPCEVVLSGWDAPGQPGTMCWRILQNGAPNVILNQGLVSYAGCLDIEVGALHTGAVPNSMNVLVAYYRVGVGHFVDVYTLTMAGITYNYSVTLSASPFYTRISMDSHLLYGAAFTWEDMGIKTMVALTTGPTITFSGVLTVGGAANAIEPDCAFTHSPMSGPPASLYVHYAYFDPTINSIVESSYDFWIMIWMLGGVVPVGINDVNGMGGAIPSPVTIDAPDHYNVENWAYTYTTNNADISVRFVDWNTFTPPTTVIVNNGTLGNFNINGSLNYNSVLSYDAPGGPMSGRISVGWYTNNINPMTANIAGYIALTMNEAGNVLLTPLDYQTIANIPTWASSTPKLAYTKMHHQSNFMYAIFPEIDPINGFRMEHKYHNWGAPAFKGETGPGYHCDDEERIKAFTATGAVAQHLSAYPNPFNDKLAIDIPINLYKEDATVTVTNIVGKKYGSFTGKMSGINEYLSTLSPKLLSGTYLVTVNIQGKNSETLKVVKAQAD